MKFIQNIKMNLIIKNMSNFKKMTINQIKKI